MVVVARRMPRAKMKNECIATGLLASLRSCSMVVLNDVGYNISLRWGFMPKRSEVGVTPSELFPRNAKPLVRSDAQRDDQYPAYLDYQASGKDGSHGHEESCP